MARGAAHHAYKNGLWSGWNEYRYSSDAASRVTVAPIFNSARRESLAGRVAHLMEDWQASPFEQEGPLRHGLRSFLCLAGNSWDAANAEAASIVDMAISELGLERPTYEEGQRDHSHGVDYCSWCACPIDDERRTRGQRFCSVECAKSAVLAREPMTKNYEGMVLRAAVRMISRDRAPARPCKQCGHLFKSESDAAVYCSPQCMGDAKRVLADITCEACGKVTTPVNQGQRFCSLECRSTVLWDERRARLAEVVKQCDECGKDFTPRSSTNRHCSNRCAAKERNRLYKERGGQAASYAYICRCCGVGFTSRMPRAPFCSKPCKDLVERYEEGKAKRMTPRVFDYMMHRDRVPMTGLHVTDGLFA